MIRTSIIECSREERLFLRVVFCDHPAAQLCVMVLRASFWHKKLHLHIARWYPRSGLERTCWCRDWVRRSHNETAAWLLSLYSLLAWKPTVKSNNYDGEKATASTDPRICITANKGLRISLWSLDLPKRFGSIVLSFTMSTDFGTYMKRKSH